MPGISFSGRDGMKRSTPGWSRGGSYSGLFSLLQGWGQMKANNSRWPTFNRIFVNYPRFTREWVAQHADLSHYGKQRLDS